jgi:alpha-amylase
LVGEVWDTNFAVSRYVQGDQFDVAFNFDLGEAMLASANTGTTRAVNSALSFTQRLLPQKRFGAFLTNHDIDRVMSQLRSEDKARVAASMLLTMPGVPFIYYGEEIGMIGQKPDERIRTPMQWSSDTGVGFTSGIPWQSPQSDYQEKNIENQKNDPASLLNHYRMLNQLRNRHAALRVGELTPIDASQQSIYAVLRHYENDLVLVLINLGSTEISDYNLSLNQGPLSAQVSAVLLYGEETFNGAELTPPTSSPRGGFEAYQPLPVLPPFSTMIIQLQAR